MRRLDTGTDIGQFETICEAIGIKNIIIMLSLRANGRKGTGSNIVTGTLRLGLRLQ
jgi:hypothetical protein